MRELEGTAVENFPVFSEWLGRGCSGLGLSNKKYVSMTVDVHLLVLARCDMVLGIQWLRELGNILWNFGRLSMKFNFG